MSRIRSAGRIRGARIAVAVGVLAVIAGGAYLEAEIGTLCTWCPIGLAQASAAARSFLPGMLLPFAAFAAVALLVGRAFCAWGCPTNLFKRRGADRSGEAAESAARTGSCATRPARRAIYSRARIHRRSARRVVHHRIPRVLPHLPDWTCIRLLVRALQVAFHLPAQLGPHRVSAHPVRRVSPAAFVVQPHLSRRRLAWPHRAPFC